MNKSVPVTQTIPFVFDTLRAHLECMWPDREKEEFVWTLGPVLSTLPRFRVVRVAPGGGDDSWVYVSLGAWEVLDAQPPLEFFILSPREDPIHVETLAMLVNYHADVRHTVRLGDVIRIGRRWLDESAADRLLVCLPYPYGPAFEKCRVGTGVVQFLWLVPITADEEVFLREHGTEAFEQRLEDSGVNVLDPKRPSVV